jgi:enoyl-CoA hydratase/carnithine racemase
MAGNVVLYEKKDHIAFVTFNRPEAMNSYNDRSHAELVKIWKDVNGDVDVRAVVLTGAGRKAFCAGRDVKELKVYQQMGKLVPRYDPASPTYDEFGYIWKFDIHKPIVGAINGFAIGGGLIFFLNCDLRVMAEDAWISDGHVAIGQMGGPEVIARQMPHALASEIILMGGRIDAKRCYEVGLVNKVVPGDDVMPEATRMAERVCEMAPLGVQRSKEVIQTLQKVPHGVKQLSDHYAAYLRTTEDGREGPLAFEQKRKPVWRTR